jgi:putative ATP-dependent endonuclease of OLD family
VEGSTEAVLFPAASTVMENSLGADVYTHFDLMGVSVFDAGADNSVPRHGPIFAALGKLAFGVYDKPNTPLPAEATAKLASFTKAWEWPEKGIENVLVKQTPIDVRGVSLRRSRTALTIRASAPMIRPCRMLTPPCSRPRC